MRSCPEVAPQAGAANSAADVLAVRRIRTLIAAGLYTELTSTASPEAAAPPEQTCAK